MSLPNDSVFESLEKIVFVVENVDDGEPGPVVEHIFFGSERAFADRRLHFVYRPRPDSIIWLLI